MKTISQYEQEGAIDINGPSGTGGGWSWNRADYLIESITKIGPQELVVSVIRKGANLEHKLHVSVPTLKASKGGLALETIQASPSLIGGALSEMDNLKVLE